MILRSSNSLKEWSATLARHPSHLDQIQIKNTANCERHKPPAIHWLFTFWGHWSKSKTIFITEYARIHAHEIFALQIHILWVPTMYFRVTKIDVDLIPTAITSAPSNYVFSTAYHVVYTIKEKLKVGPGYYYKQL